MASTLMDVLEEHEALGPIAGCLVVSQEVVHTLCHVSMAVHPFVRHLWRVPTPHFIERDRAIASNCGACHNTTEVKCESDTLAKPRS